MAERATRVEAWSYAQLVLTNAVAVSKGEMVCIDTSTGLVTIGATSTTLKPIGYAEENLTGDGVATVRIRLFREIWLHQWVNDVATPVVAADIGSDCYILDGSTVTGDATGASVAGQVWAVTTSTVLVEMVGF